MNEPIIQFNANDSEADTCRKEVLPKLYESLWTDELILEQRTFTDGKIIVIGRKARRKKAKRFDYLLRYSQNFPIAIIEAKKKYKSASDGMQQAKEYAEILGLKFAYSTNGTDILEFDFLTGIEQKIDRFPQPEELWARLSEKDNIDAEIKETFLKPFYATIGKELRYYQRNAVNASGKSNFKRKKKSIINFGYWNW
ncbi:type I restriction endonuclease [Mucilaginibacter sp. HD30]